MKKKIILLIPVLIVSYAVLREIGQSTLRSCTCCGGPPQFQKTLNEISTMQVGHGTPKSGNRHGGGMAARAEAATDRRLLTVVKPPAFEI